MKSEPSIKVAEFGGLNNMAEPRAMQPGELTAADNIDIDDRKKIRRRVGSLLRKPVADLQSAWATPDERRMFVVAEGVLSEVDDDLNLIPLADGFDDRPAYFAWDTERIFCMSEANAVVIDGAEVYPMRVDTPLPPAVTVTGGSLPAGIYLVGCLNEDEQGRQGGCSTLRAVRVPENGGLAIRAYPLNGFTVRFCVSATNGTVLHHIQSDDAGVARLESLDGLMSRIDEPQYYGMPIPLGGPIAYHEGSLYVADGGMVYRSHPYWPHLFDLSAQGLALAGRVTLLASLEATGLLVGTDRGIYVLGSDDQLTQIADYGAVPGQTNHFRYDEGEQIKVYFWTDRGMAVAPPFQLLMEGRVSADPGDRCAVGLVEQGGFKRLVASTRIGHGSEAPNPR